MATRKKVCIVVLGDSGRSPRMQYHALSLVQEGYSVDIVGYAGSNAINELLESANVQFKYLPQVPNFKAYLPNLFAFVFKVLFQFFTLMWCLNVRLSCFPNYLLLQNPPAIPSILVAVMYCSVYRIKLIIDWHNYAYTILKLSLGSEHKLVTLSEKYERVLGKWSKNNLCVTRAMRDDLKNNWNIQATTLYDRAPDRFHPTSARERAVLMEKLSLDYPELSKLISPDKKSSALVGLLVSSTSWTEDEDFSILFNALSLYDADAEASTPLIVVVTGKGPMKQYYLDQIKAKSWSKITIYTPWLSAEDYPLLIGCADLGVSLHTSSSGLDLPMKVVDMFGCGVPVCAKNFQCLNELVQHDVNGFVFDSEVELSAQIKVWFKNESMREKVQNNVGQFRRKRWHENWKLNALPMFR